MPGEDKEVDPDDTLKEGLNVENEEIVEGLGVLLEAALTERLDDATKDVLKGWPDKVLTEVLK